MKLKDFKYCIIVDKNDRPMAWDNVSKQVCYCCNENMRDYIHPVKVVTIKTARAQIQKTIKNRKSWGFDVDEYCIMPVKVTHK